jgi:hypothetical protein
MKTLLFVTVAAFATITASANTSNKNTGIQKIAYVEVAQTIDRDGNGNTARTLAKGYGQREIAEIFETTPVESRRPMIAGLF